MRLNYFSIFLFILFLTKPILANEHEAPAAAEPETEMNPEMTPEEMGLKITDNPEDIKVPAQMWDLIGSEKKSQLIFVPVTLVLTEKNPGILKQSPTRLTFPRGGGEIDLSRFLTGRPGSFYVKFIFDPHKAKDSSKVFFVSQTRKRKIDGEVFGTGCKKFLEISHGLDKVSKGEGILVNTTRSRHVTVLGGSFVFASVQNRDIRLSQVTFKDSNHPEYFCEMKKNEAPESI